MFAIEDFGVEPGVDVLVIEDDPLQKGMDIMETVLAGLAG